MKALMKKSLIASVLLVAASAQASSQFQLADSSTPFERGNQDRRSIEAQAKIQGICGQVLALSDPENGGIDMRVMEVACDEIQDLHPESTLEILDMASKFANTFTANSTYLSDRIDLSSANPAIKARAHASLLMSLSQARAFVFEVTYTALN